MQQSDSDPSALSDLLRSVRDQLYHRLKIETLLFDPPLHFYNVEKRCCGVFENMLFRVISIPIPVIYKALGHARLSYRSDWTKGFVSRRPYFARIGRVSVLRSSYRTGISRWIRGALDSRLGRGRFSCVSFFLARPERYHSRISVVRQDIHAQRTEYLPAGLDVGIKRMWRLVPQVGACCSNQFARCSRPDATVPAEPLHQRLLEAISGFW
jgi:hypothetical protein